MHATLSLSLGLRDALWSFFLSSEIVTHVRPLDVRFGHSNDTRSFLSIGMRVVVSATRYSQPKEKPSGRAAGRHQITSIL
jgi:hypothetical protein